MMHRGVGDWPAYRIRHRDDIRQFDTLQIDTRQIGIHSS